MSLITFPYCFAILVPDCFIFLASFFCEKVIVNIIKCIRMLIEPYAIILNVMNFI